MILEPGAQSLFGECAVDAQQSANTRQGKAKPELYRRKTFDEDDQNE